ncbi:unnamed protein product [Medioppia subpectinata]|uniref:Serpin domain-containing protein n=1 Tax=Medioppia subpectinata TaxID=1979941 RepID=A0A7R9KLN7_9ACAR|nr:unnamed protein product [Medioppia subpectinata]CAG2105557.1 unnamed protein product [Medioppia subpectinata]
MSSRYVLNPFMNTSKLLNTMKYAAERDGKWIGDQKDSRQYSWTDRQHEEWVDRRFGQLDPLKRKTSLLETKSMKTSAVESWKQKKSLDNAITLSLANNHLGVDILQQLYDNQKNAFFSPFSISMAFAMVFMGAKGKTHEELYAGLGYKSVHLSDIQINEQFQEILTELNDKYKIRPYALRVANKLIIRARFPIEDKYQGVLTKYYHSAVESIDFRNNPVAIREALNTWVANTTNNKIQEILPKPLDPVDQRGAVHHRRFLPKPLDPVSTYMVLLNAIYFKGLFANKFDPKETKEEPFITGETGAEHKKVPMMHRKGVFNYTEISAIDSKLLELPYAGDEISLYLLLPNQPQGLSKSKHQLKDFAVIEKAITRCYSMEVDVTVPKFKIDAQYSLKDLFMTLGISSLFGPTAVLTGISERKNLYVSEVIHKASVEVSEMGTEASAATAIKINTKSPKQQLTFRADHPFTFFIRQNRNGMLLFAGYVNKL